MTAPFQLTVAEWRSIIVTNANLLKDFAEQRVLLDTANAEQVIEHLERLKTVVRGWCATSQPEIERNLAMAKEIEERQLKPNGHAPLPDKPEAPKKRRGRPPKNTQPTA